MVTEHHVQGYENFVKFMERFSKNDVVNVYFSGSKLPNGESWCDDCVRAWPHVKRSLTKAPANSHFIYVEVGDRPFWKDNKCPFRTNSKTRLLVLPSLIRWQGFQKLEGEQCEKEELLEMFFTDDE